MIQAEKNGLSFFRFPNLAAFPEIRHGIFTRKGGHGKGAFQGLNVGFGVGDSEDTVLENRARISECMEAEALVFVNQVHGTEVFEPRTPNPEPRTPKADAMITDVRGRFLAIQVADCQAVLIYDPKARVVANLHSGWRGSITNIIGRTIRRMEEGFGCDPRHMLAGIGPSLGPCCAEFVSYRSEIPEAFWKYKNDADHFDFWKISRDQLVVAGLSEKNVSSSGLCSKCRTDLFFSYRGERKTGRFAAVIGLA